MTVTISKPAFSLRETLNALKKKTGVFGEQVMRAETVSDFYNVVGINRNLLINGDFRVSQRADYSSPTAMSSQYTLDRWVNYQYNITGTLQHTTVTFNNETHRALKVVLTNTTSGELLMEQRVEPINLISGKTYTLSAWVRTNNNSVRFRIHDGNGWVSAPAATFCPPDGQWHKITWSYPYYSPVSGYHPVQMYCNSGISGDWYEFTDMQLEEGTVATPFERRHYQQELALCQRYYEKSFPDGVTPGNGVDSTSGANGSKVIAHFAPWLGSGAAVVSIPMKVPKRTTPSVGQYGNSSGQLGFLANGVLPTTQTAVNYSANISVQPLDANELYINNQYTQNTLFCIYGGWTASAEL